MIRKDLVTSEKEERYDEIKVFEVPEMREVILPDERSEDKVEEFGIHRVGD